MYSNKTVINKTIEAITDYLNELDNDELVNIHNQYCQNCNNSDNEIYNNDEDFFNTFFDGKVMEAVRAISFGEYKYNDDYVKFDGYANLESFDNPSSHVDIAAIANDILENPENYDIELTDVFFVNGICYEGTEDDAKEEYEEFIKDEYGEGLTKAGAIADNEIITFEEWVKYFRSN